MKSNIAMTHDKPRAPGCGWRVRAPGQSRRPAVAATSVAGSRDQGAGARVWGVPATGSALPPGRATRARAAPRSGGEGRLYGQGPSERPGPGAQTGARRRVQPERSGEPRPDRLPARAAPGCAWPHGGPVRGDRQGRVGRRWPRGLRPSPPRRPLFTGAGHDQPPGHAGGSPRLPRQDDRPAPCSGALCTSAGGSASGDRRGPHGDIFPGRPRIPGHWVAVPGSPTALDRGDAASSRCARGRSTGP
jgi:hypothetical protein